MPVRIIFISQFIIYNIDKWEIIKIGNNTWNKNASHCNDIMLAIKILNAIRWVLKNWSNKLFWKKPGLLKIWWRFH